MRLQIAMLAVSLLVLAVLACGPTEDDLRELVREEIAELELPRGPEGPQGIQGPEGTCRPTGATRRVLTRHGIGTPSQSRPCGSWTNRITLSSPFRRKRTSTQPSASSEDWGRAVL